MARRKYFKHGDPTMHTWFNDSQWDNMTADQKKNWVPSDEIEEHPVPEEVKNFMKQPQVNPNDDIAKIEPMAKDLQKLADYIVKTFPDHKFTGNVVDDTINIIEKLMEGGVTEEEIIPEDEIEKEENEKIEKLSFDPTDRNFLKTELTKLKVEFDKRMSTKKLAKLYEKTIAKNK